MKKQLEAPDGIEGFDFIQKIGMAYHDKILQLMLVCIFFEKNISTTFYCIFEKTLLGQKCRHILQCVQSAQTAFFHNPLRCPMSVKKAIKMLDWWIDLKRQHLEKFSKKSEAVETVLSILRLIF